MAIHCLLSHRFPRSPFTDSFRFADNSEADLWLLDNFQVASRLVIGDNGRGTLKMSRNPEMYANAPAPGSGQANQDFL